MTSAKTSWIAGADGFRDGWFVVLSRAGSNEVRRRSVGSVATLLDLPEQPAVTGIDMVIGCPDAAEPGGRTCDRLARNLLGHPRGACVFSPPAHAALTAETYEEANRRNRGSGPDAPGLSKQTFHLIPRIRSLSEEMRPEHQDRIREVHPELAFYAMNGDASVNASKHGEKGIRTRVQLLADNGFPEIDSAIENIPNGSLGADDVLDAHAASWTARLMYEGTAERCPPLGQKAPRNDRGLRMEIWR